MTKPNTPPWETPPAFADQLKAAAADVLARELKAAPAWQHDRIRREVAEATQAFTGETRTGNRFVVEIEAARGAFLREWRQGTASRAVAAELDGSADAWREAQSAERRERAQLPKRDAVADAMLQARRLAVLNGDASRDTPAQRAQWRELAEREAAAMRGATDDAARAKSARRARHFLELADTPVPPDVETTSGGANASDADLGF